MTNDFIIQDTASRHAWEHLWTNPGRYINIHRLHTGIWLCETSTEYVWYGFTQISWLFWRGWRDAVFLGPTMIVRTKYMGIYGKLESRSNVAHDPVGMASRHTLINVYAMKQVNIRCSPGNIYQDSVTELACCAVPHHACASTHVSFCVKLFYVCVLSRCDHPRCYTPTRLVVFVRIQFLVIHQHTELAQPYTTYVKRMTFFCFV